MGTITMVGSVWSDKRLWFPFKDLVVQERCQLLIYSSMKSHMKEVLCTWVVETLAFFEGSMITVLAVEVRFRP